MSKTNLNSLLDHFDEEKEGDKYELGDISELVSIYGNLKLINDKYYITYNSILTNEKEEIIEIFEKSTDNICKEIVEDSINCYDLIDEENYLIMLDDLVNKDLKYLYIIEKNITINKIVLENKIKILKYLFGDKLEIKIAVIENKIKNTPVKEEFLDILRKYWNYDSFRKMKVYNINKLNYKEKVIEEISQYNIISDIVAETEKCIKKKDYRDIFITAPTGAGKSVMFQIPSIYLAEKYKLFTIVISPLIGLMKDQVENLKIRNYKFVRTINSDTSPIEKQNIINDIANYKCHILYLSPESLLSKSDLDQLIGNRTLGLLVVDEAHIVTTWGKQFRPDYWYLGDHLNKIKKSQLRNEEKGIGFVIATFTATAIYGGIENMYEETIESLRMVNPITYLGYVKREDININIEKAKLITNKFEYEQNKFEHLIEKMDEALMRDKKMLIYFPTVALINRFYEHCIIANMSQYVSKYHGQLSAYEKDENYRRFLSKETPIMIATKAFGMGIDINDIEIVAHFAPTGNVCDYVQEIGRAARKSDLMGEAYYKFMNNDFKHINKLHGLSTIKEYQLIEVVKKVYELYQNNIKNNREKRLTKKRNGMLVDAESFSHIFETTFSSEDDGINKVKTAMLLIQKDFERTFSFSPFHVRPIPLFETGYFQINATTQKAIKQEYGNIFNELDSLMHICSLNLKKIWEQSFVDKYSFSKFKFMLYSKNEELNFEYRDHIKPALSIEIDFKDNYTNMFQSYINSIKAIVNRSVREEKFYNIDGEKSLVTELMENVKINKYKAKSIIDTLIAAMSVYKRDYSNNIHSKMFATKPLKSGEVKYKFMHGTNNFFNWLESGFYKILDNVKNGTMYLIDDTGNKGFKETLMLLGIFETMDLLVFKSLGGKNSQIYIYVNQTKTMREILAKPYRYKNKLLEIVSKRHQISVEMLTYIYEGNFTNEEIWNLIEDYFLGIIPEVVIKSYEKKTGKKLEEI